MTENLRFEGLTLTVESVERSIAFYSGKLGLKVERNAIPAFAMIRHGAVTLGLLAAGEARKEGVADSNPSQKAAIHVEFTTDDLDGLYEEPWERSMTAFDPDGYAVEFAQGKRGHNQTKA